MRIKCFIFVLITICFVSCIPNNLIEGLQVSKNFEREYTGLDTLIRIDGYYYMEDSTGVSFPFFFSNDRWFKEVSFYFKTHEDLQHFATRSDVGDYGNYVLSGDTIIVRAAFEFARWAYSMSLSKYLIVNDTILKQIWYSSDFNGKREVEKNDIYHFYEYKFDEE